MIRAALVFALMAGAASAAPQCADRAVVLMTLAVQYGEVPRHIGIAADLTLMELFVNEKTRSWTITSTTPSKITCLVAAGQNYESIAETPPGPPGEPG